MQRLEAMDEWTEVLSRLNLPSETRLFLVLPISRCVCCGGGAFLHARSGRPTRPKVYSTRGPLAAELCCKMCANEYFQLLHRRPPSPRRRRPSPRRRRRRLPRHCCPSCRRTPIPRRRCLPRHCCPSCRRTPIPRRRRRRRFPRCQGRRLAESLAARGVQPCICALCRGSVTSGGARAPRDRTLFSGATVVALYLKIDSSCFCFILRVQRWLQLEPVLPASPRSGGFRWTDSCQAALTERKERPQCLIFTGNTPTDNLLGGSPNNLRVVFTGIGYHP